MQRGAGIMIAGAGMLIIGHFLSQGVLDLMPTINPANSSLISDANYHMLSISNQLSTISQFGIVVMVIGAIVFFTDRMKARSKTT